jgi:hypothetical protein
MGPSSRARRFRKSRQAKMDAEIAKTPPAIPTRTPIFAPLLRSVEGLDVTAFVFEFEVLSDE